MPGDYVHPAPVHNDDICRRTRRGLPVCTEDRGQSLTGRVRGGHGMHIGALREVDRLAVRAGGAE
jgi:hypothetical protein